MKPVSVFVAKREPQPIDWADTVESVTLVLSPEHARTLRALTGAVCGDPTNTWNKEVAEIWEAFARAGVPSVQEGRFTRTTARHRSEGAV